RLPPVRRVVAPAGVLCDRRAQARVGRNDAPGLRDGDEVGSFPPMSHPQFPNLTVLTHPLIQHKLAILRDKNTTTKDFKQLVNEIAMLMAYEVTKDLPLEPTDVDTPLEHTRGVRVACPRPWARAAGPW